MYTSSNFTKAAYNTGEVMKIMLTAIYARDKMDAIIQLVKKSEGE